MKVVNLVLSCSILCFAIYKIYTLLRKGLKMPSHDKPSTKSTFVMALDVVCPKCRARVGEQCFDLKRFMAHQRRRKLAFATFLQYKGVTTCLNQKSESGGTATSKATT